MCIGLHLSARYSCQILMKVEFSKQILLKIRPVGAELFQADGLAERQTDMTKITPKIKLTGKPSVFSLEKNLLGVGGGCSD